VRQWRGVSTLGDTEQLMVCQEVHARHLQDMHKLEGVPNALGVQALVFDMCLLQVGEVGGDVAGGFLLVLVLHTAVENECSLRKRLVLAVDVLPVYDQHQWQWLLRLACDNAEDAKLTQLRLHGGAPHWVVGLLKEGHRELQWVVCHGRGMEGKGEGWRRSGRCLKTPSCGGDHAEVLMTR
jgi:hypothetical protein